MKLDVVFINTFSSLNSTEFLCLVTQKLSVVAAFDLFLNFI